MLASDLITPESLRKLHPGMIEEPAAIRAFLEELKANCVELRRGANRRIDPEIATIESVADGHLVLRTRNFERFARDQVFLNLTHAGRPYFFSAQRLGDLVDGRLRVRLPAVIYSAERANIEHHRTNQADGAPRRVALRAPGGATEAQAEVCDFSADGLSVQGGDPALLELGSELRVRFLDGGRAGQELYARVRHREPAAGARGWQRIGLSVSEVPSGAPLAVERRESIVPGSARSRARRQLSAWAAGARVGALRTLRRGDASDGAVRIVDYENRRGERLRAIVDATGDTRGAPAVVIPPAWGKTKETLLPLAATVAATFRNAGLPVTVIRFDGIRKRGESHTEPECRAPGAENYRFTFSQGVEDIEATLDFLEQSPEFRPSTTVLISFSGASIDARRAVALDSNGKRRLDGWVCVVGSADLQAMMRVISGGVDYLGGVERGIRFGLQEVLGLVVDVDTSSRDALDHQLAFLEDARRDFSQIRVPVTWLHGRYDAWMDLDRIRHAMSCGDTRGRRLIEVPTGHQLRASREALEVFQLIATEASRMALGHPLEAALPDLVALDRQRRAERARLPDDAIDLRDFWRGYLVGRDGRLGMELLTSTRPYRELMALQIESLDLQENQRVADLGAGTGSFVQQLTASPDAPARLEVLEVDLVLEALGRARSRIAALGAPPGLRVRYLECDLDAGEGRAIPIASGSADAVLASLLINYLLTPEALLAEIHRIVRPGGRVVLSSLRPDADISQICVEGVAELRAGRGREAFGAEAERRLSDSIRGFMSDAARVLDFEEQGAFHFPEAEELVDLLEQAGFQNVSVTPAFGEPPQAFVLVGRRG